MVAFARNRIEPLDDSGIRDWLAVCGSDAELRAMRRQLADLIADIDRRLYPRIETPPPQSDIGVGFLAMTLVGAILWAAALSRLAAWFAG